MLDKLGVFMGSHLNDSEDSIDVFDLVRYLVEAHAPDYSKLFCDGDPSLRARALAAFGAHLADRPEDQRWGWKLPETSHAMPVIGAAVSAGPLHPSGTRRSRRRLLAVSRPEGGVLAQDLLQRCKNLQLARSRHDPARLSRLWPFVQRGALGKQRHPRPRPRHDAWRALPRGPPTRRWWLIRRRKWRAWPHSSARRRPT